jgi:hypothetical protein
VERFGTSITYSNKLNSRSLYLVGDDAINIGNITLTSNPCDIVLEGGYFTGLNILLKVRLNA